MATSILDINPLQHLTSDIAVSQFNYESILHGLVTWNNSKDDQVTIRLATKSEPFFRDIQLYTRHYYEKTSNTTVSERLLPAGKFAYNSRYRFVVDAGKEVVLRVNVDSLGGLDQWDLYEDVTLHEEILKTQSVDNSAYYEYQEKPTFGMDNVEGSYIRHSINHGVELLRLTSDVQAGDAIATTNTKAIVYETTNGIVDPSNTAEFFVYDGYVYIKNPATGQVYNKVISNTGSGFIKFCPVYGFTNVNSMNYGDCVYYRGEFFVYISEDTPIIAPFTEDSSGTFRKYNTDYWKSVVLVKTVYTVAGSGVVRYTTNKDVNGYVLRNGTKNASDETSDIGITGSLKIVGNPTKPHTGLDVFASSNFAEYPSLSPKWFPGNAYTTDASKNAYALQSYSAVMMFNHADPTVKLRNIINYDGPDLDQGLCIMLPCTVEVEENGSTVSKKPADGTMFEFLINIWPNHDYDGREYNDLIINKSQVYVYNVDNWSDYKTNGMSVTNTVPLAKFSMARLLNFYVHDENVGVPDRPVVYKASFIYSETEERWKTYDYYQLPDHILLSPFGFVDPLDEHAYDVQSAGFPLFQNPFSDYDLSPIHVSDSYRNQLQEDPRTQP